MKSKIQKIALLLCLIFVIYSCKKKESTKETPVNGGIFHPDKINCALTVYKFQTFNTDTLKTTNYASGAFFSDTLINYTDGYPSSDYGDVVLDSTKLKKMYISTTNSVLYYDTTASIYEGLANWDIQGPAINKGFKIKKYIDYPSYNWYKNISDTIDINKNLFLDFTELNGIYDISVSLSNYSNNQGKAMNLNTHSIIFSSNELQEIFQYGSGLGRMSILISKYDFRIINGLIVNFRTVLILEKNNFYLKI
jgi:hypothetical protein